MLSLMLKDILLLKKTIAFSALYLVFMLFVFASLDNAASVFVICMVAITYMLTVSGCALDDKNKADVILNSLPLSRSVIVGARYLMVFVYVIFAVIIYILATRVVGMMHLIPSLHPVSLEEVLGAFLSISFLASIYLPLYFKFGYIKSKIYHFILFFGMFFGISLVASGIASGNPTLLGIAAFLSRQSEGVIGAMIAGTALALLAVSYGISLRIYRNREF